MARLTRPESRAQTRARLLDAAAEVFATRGFHGASVDEVAEAAGYSKGALYSNFASKDELFLAVLQSRMQGQVELLERLSQQARTSPDDMLALLPDLDWTDLQWCLLTFEFWLYALRNPQAGERLAPLYRQFRAQLASLLAPYAGHDLPPGELATAIIALYQGLDLQRRLDPDAVRVDSVARLVAALQRNAVEDGSAGTPDTPGT
jgi:AcrR family transcriptional regulator